MRINFLSLSFFIIWTLQISLMVNTQAQSELDSIIASDTTITETGNPLIIVEREIEPVNDFCHLTNVVQSYTVKNLDFSDYKYLHDFLRYQPGVFIRDLGNDGQLDGIVIRGLDNRSVSFLYDGIPLSDPLTGVFHPLLFPTENIDYIEFVSGTRTFLYDLNSTSGAINITTKNMRAIKPYSRVRYVESAYDYSFLDGMFSQDIRRGLNLILGINHTTSNGRFPNSEYSSWQGRLKLCYNISNEMNIFASEIYNQTNLGLNGGVDPSTLPEDRFDPLRSNIRNANANEKIARHDINLGATTHLFGDTLSKITILTFYGIQTREYKDKTQYPATVHVYKSRLYGITINNDFLLSPLLFNFTAGFQGRDIIQSPNTGSHFKNLLFLTGKTECEFNRTIKTALYGRVDNYQSQTQFSYGGDFTYSLMAGISIFTGYSISHRFPTFQELYWRDSTVISDRKIFSPERHNLIESGIKFSNGRPVDVAADFALDMKITFFKRTINNPIIITSGLQVKSPFPTALLESTEKQTLQGIEGKIELRLWKLYGEGSANFIEGKYSSSIEQPFPKWYGIGGIYYWDKLFKEHLKLRIGVRGRAFSSYHGVEFNPHTTMYVQSPSILIKPIGIADGILLAHIGSAYVHFIWENLFNRRYFITPIYPMPDRTLRFGISWEFLD